MLKSKITRRIAGTAVLLTTGTVAFFVGKNHGQKEEFKRVMLAIQNPVEYCPGEAAKTDSSGNKTYSYASMSPGRQSVVISTEVRIFPPRPDDLSVTVQIQTMSAPQAAQTVQNYCSADYSPQW